MSNLKKGAGSGAQLIDYLILTLGRKNDAHISRDLFVAPPVISKVRHGHFPVGESLILAIHERYGIDVKTIREQAGTPNKFDAAKE